MSIDERSPAEKVPLEIIPNILQYLSASDRKNASLVNSQWYQASQTLMFQKRRRFVFDGSIHKNQLGLVLNEIEGFSSQYYDLEFHNEDFNLTLNEFLNFMKFNSLYICRLSFINCSFPFTMVEEIMINCINLEELIFKHGICDGYEEAMLSNLKGLMIQKKLISLEIQGYLWMTENVFRIFCDTYPNIQRIRMGGGGFARFVANFQHAIEKRKPSFLQNGISNCFKDDFFNQLVSYPWIQLEELSIRDHDWDYARNDFEAFLLRQRNLKSLNMKWIEHYLYLDSFELIFHYIPNLKRLNFRLCLIKDVPSITRVIELVANSQLEVLQLDICSFHQVDPHLRKFRRNRHTYYLSISTLCYARTVCTTLLTSLLYTFCNLTYLNVSGTSIQGSSRELVTLLFQEQNQLRYLKANNCSWIGDTAFKRCRLFKLEFLELQNARIKHAAFSKFDFPKLKFLHLEGCYRIPDESFASLPSKCPLLRYLNVKGTRISDKTILNVCENLKFLHCIIIVKRKMPPIVDVDTISQICPSLRFIQMGRFTPHHYYLVGDLYVYDYFEKIWNKYDDTQLQCIRCQPSRRRLKNVNF